MNFMQKIAMALVKKMLLNKIADEKYQEEIVKKITDKIKIPNMTPAEEIKIINNIYDVVQLTLKEIIEKY